MSRAALALLVISCTSPNAGIAPGLADAQALDGPALADATRTLDAGADAASPDAAAPDAPADTGLEAPPPDAAPDLAADRAPDAFVCAPCSPGLHCDPALRRCACPTDQAFCGGPTSADDSCTTTGVCVLALESEIELSVPLGQGLCFLAKHPSTTPMRIRWAIDTNCIRWSLLEGVTWCQGRAGTAYIRAERHYDNHGNFLDETRKDVTCR